jgi:hypothetical protein
MIMQAQAMRRIAALFHAKIYKPAGIVYCPGAGEKPLSFPGECL